jgi:hypothetical protein
MIGRYDLCSCILHKQDNNRVLFTESRGGCQYKRICGEGSISNFILGSHYGNVFYDSLDHFVSKYIILRAKQLSTTDRPKPEVWQYHEVLATKFVKF